MVFHELRWWAVKNKKIMLQQTNSFRPRLTNSQTDECLDLRIFFEILL